MATLWLLRGFKAAEIACVVATGVVIAMAARGFGVHETPYAATLVIIGSALIMFETLHVLGLYALPRVLRPATAWRAALAASALSGMTSILCLLALQYPAATVFGLGLPMGLGFGAAVLGLRLLAPEAMRRWHAALSRPVPSDRHPLDGWAGFSKAAFDRGAAMVLLVALAPLLIVAAVLVRIETPGPVLFRQPRVGYGNRLFHIFKIRTMHHAATDLLAATQTTRNDKRITKVGAVLRKLSIDELPQLLNVLRGEMSLVGPRPHAPGTSVAGQRLDALIAVYPNRHAVKPGITGLAQVRGHRGALHTMDQLTNRLDSDLEYIRTRSLYLDVKILVLTVVREIRSSRAY